MATTSTIDELTRSNDDDPVRIVMVDDDPSEHVLMRAAAREANIATDFTFFEDGADALLHLIGAAADDLPDVIVLDLRMPGLDGHSTLDEIQADAVLWQVPVVVFTSSPRTSDIEMSLDRGAVSYIVKPSDFDTMVNNVVDLCDLARRGVRPRKVDDVDSGRVKRREKVEAIGVLVEDYLLQLQLEADARRSTEGNGAASSQPKRSTLTVTTER